ncbi:hypothetical protein M422DRAFT_132654, partial [Sphaerobolus stellatus SS14]
LPNPETPLAWLDPTLASQFEVTRYLLVATCGMFAWDLLTNLRNDYKLLTRYRVGLPTVIYFISRIFTFAFIICGTIISVGAVGNCQHLLIAIGCCFAIAVTSNSLLFFFRLRAVFNADPYTIAFFSFMVLATFGGGITVPFGISGTHIGTTNRCLQNGVRAFSSAGIVISTVNDTLVFIAITWRLLQTTTYEDTLRARVKSFFKREGLPAFARALLESGQEYYLRVHHTDFTLTSFIYLLFSRITVGGNILTMAMIFAPASLPAIYHAMFTVPNIAIANSMACRVYRNIK